MPIYSKCTRALTFENVRYALQKAVAEEMAIEVAGGARERGMEAGVKEVATCVQTGGRVLQSANPTDSTTAVMCPPPQNVSCPGAVSACVFVYM